MNQLVVFKPRPILHKPKTRNWDSAFGFVPLRELDAIEDPALRREGYLLLRERAQANKMATVLAQLSARINYTKAPLVSLSVDRIKDDTLEPRPTRCQKKWNAEKRRVHYLSIADAPRATVTNVKPSERGRINLRAVALVKHVFARDMQSLVDAGDKDAMRVRQFAVLAWLVLHKGKRTVNLADMLGVGDMRERTVSNCFAAAVEAGIARDVKVYNRKYKREAIRLKVVNSHVPDGGEG